MAGSGPSAIRPVSVSSQAVETSSATSGRPCACGSETGWGKLSSRISPGYPTRRPQHMTGPLTRARPGGLPTAGQGSAIARETDGNTTEGAWRDERRLPLADLTAAVATSSDDGQTDDLAGNDAGIEETLSDEGRDRRTDGDPDPTSSAGR